MTSRQQDLFAVLAFIVGSIALAAVLMWAVGPATAPPPVTPPQPLPAPQAPVWTPAR